MNISIDKFGKYLDGRDVDLITLQNNQNTICKITNYGATVVSWLTRDKNNKEIDVVCGFDTLDDFYNDASFMGAIIGRYGNRIGNAKFEIDGMEYTLAANNNNKNHLHGGIKGFDKKFWDYKIFENNNEVGIILSYLSKDMEEGYPGNLNVEVKYALNNNNELKILYSAKTDKKTHCNLTNHMYFNLNGAVGDVLNHQLRIKAKKITEIDNESIPTGELLDVEKTDFDFNKLCEIGTRRNGEYDHNFVLDKKVGELEHIAEVYEPATGIKMDVFTTEPGVQLYTASHFNNLKGKDGKIYHKCYAYCLETQHFPDSPNKKHFPTTILNPGEKYYQETIYKLSCKH